MREVVYAQKSWYVKSAKEILFSSYS